MEPEGLVDDRVEVRKAVIKLVVCRVAAAAEVRELLFSQLIL